MKLLSEGNRHDPIPEDGFAKPNSARSSILCASVDDPSLLQAPQTQPWPINHPSLPQQQPHVSVLPSDNSAGQEPDSGSRSSIDHTPASDLAGLLTECVAEPEHSVTIQLPAEHREEDMKEVQIETEDPSHLFWVCIHVSMYPQVNEHNLIVIHMNGH